MNVLLLEQEFLNEKWVHENDAIEALCRNKTTICFDKIDGANIH